ncbi:MAG: 30S ribosomal protein S16 [Actinomycetaceae bacterium]|nr:30S ribosomal protein S16 [Actinomycetaceae bacterium]
MAVRIRLKRVGKIHRAIYRVVVVDSRKKRDGQVIERVGQYDPNQEPSLIKITSERVQYWLGVGAQPSDAVRRLLVLSGDWAKFKGAKNTESRIKVKESDNSAATAEAIKAAADEAEKRKAAQAEAKAKEEAEKKAAAEAAAKEAETAASESTEATETSEEA